MIICLCETKLTKDVCLEVMGWENYNLWRRDREGKWGGGVLILTHKKLKVNMIDLRNNGAEVIAVEVINENSENTDVAVAYMPPYTRAWTAEEYQRLKEDTIKTIETLIHRNNELILVGDFNCKEVNWEEGDAGSNMSSWGNVLLDLITDNLLIQNIKEHTRQRGKDEPSRLDLAFTRDPDMITNTKYLPPLGKSDHPIIEMEILMGYPVMLERETHKESRLNYGRADFKALKCYFKDTDWSEIEQKDNVNEKYLVFKNIYDDAVNRYVPKQGNMTAKIKDWFNDNCRIARDKRDKAWDITRRRRNEQTWNKYKRLRNEYVRIRKQEARNYEKNIVDKCESDPKLFYRYVNSKMKITDKIMRLREGDNIYDDDEKMCEIMNNALHSVYTRDEQFLEPEIIYQNEEKLGDISFQPEELLELMKGLDVRKSIGPDNIAGWIIKECADELVKPLYEIMKYSLEVGKLPLDWKRANVVPIFKSGNREQPLNYRPVSLTSIVCKMCEKIIKKRWVKYLETNNVLTARQFGFREGTSCVTNLLSFYDRVVDILQEREGWVDCVYLDIKKAFDRVPHSRLRWKLKKFGGVQGSLLSWMEDYLSGRQMRTMIRGKVSAWKDVTSGVPQGAVLAPIMFLIYINDMPKDINAYMNMFADDAKIMKHIVGENSCRELQSDLDKINQWSEMWKLEFNTDKCHVMEVGVSKRRPHWEYKLGECVINPSEKEKDLGIIVRGDLSPESHINKVVGEAYGLLNRVRIAFNYLNEDMLVKIIKSMVRPKLEYAAVVWSPHLKKHITKLEKVQKVATKMIPELRQLTYEERLEKLNLPTLRERRERGDVIMMYKCVRGLERIDKDDFIERDTGRTRGHSCKLKKGTCKGDVRKYSFPYRTVNVWNQLEDEVVGARNIHNFKANFDNKMLGSGTIRA